MNDALEQRVQERTAQLAAANVELARANQLKDEFLSAVSHELRTPLTGILGIADVLQMQRTSAPVETQVRYGQILRRSGERLLDLVNGILRYTALLAGRRPIRREHCHLGEVSAIALLRIQAKAEAKGIHVEAAALPANPRLLGDAEAMVDILVELLDNAVKVTAEGGRVGLAVQRREDAGPVQFVVWDTGTGIAPEMLAHIFEPFVQGDGSFARQVQGVGLGLAYVHRLVGAMGGTITVESEVGKGSRFVVTLPLAEPSSP
jgi:signal transduction histidine kinase